MQLKPLHKCFSKRKLQQKFFQIFHSVTPNIKRMCTQELRLTINRNLIFNNMSIINNFYLTTRSFLRKIGILKLCTVVKKKMITVTIYCHSLHLCQEPNNFIHQCKCQSSEKGKGREGQNEREKPKQPPCPSRSPTQGSIPQPRDAD